jgi:hypothetical protein
VLGFRIFLEFRVFYRVNGFIGFQVLGFRVLGFRIFQDFEFRV